MIKPGERQNPFTRLDDAYQSLPRPTPIDPRVPPWTPNEVLGAVLLPDNKTRLIDAGTTAAAELLLHIPSEYWTNQPEEALELLANAAVAEQLSKLGAWLAENAVAAARELGATWADVALCLNYKTPGSAARRFDPKQRELSRESAARARARIRAINKAAEAENPRQRTVPGT